MATKSSYSERRKKFLELVVANIPLMSDEVLEEWSTDEQSLRNFLTGLATLSPAPVCQMENYLFNKSWRYVIPPQNHTHFVITQRLDSSYAHVGKTEQCFYVSIEEHLGNGVWQQLPGSVLGGMREWQYALNAAAKLWAARMGNKS
jgi:hypothetical protein